MANLKGKYDRSVVPEMDLGRQHYIDRQDTEQHTEYPWEEEQSKIVARPLGRGKGKLLQENMRRLPSDYVAKDLEDPNRIHELDPHHIRGALAQEKFDGETGFRATAFGTGEAPEPTAEEATHIPVNDMTVSLVKLRVFSALLERAQEAHKSRDFVKWHEAMAVHHLWFPEDDLNQRQLARGNPPPDSQRPPHLVGLDLVVDPKSGIPQRCLDLIQSDRRRRETFVEHFDEQVLEEAMKLVNESFNPVLVPR